MRVGLAVDGDAVAGAAETLGANDGAVSGFMGCAVGIVPKSNFATGALVLTGAGWSIPGIRMVPVAGPRGEAVVRIGEEPGGVETGLPIPGIRTGGGDPASALSGAGREMGLTALSPPVAPLAMSFANSEIRSSDLSPGSDIFCGPAGGIHCAHKLVLPRPGPRRAISNHHANAPEL